MKIWEKLLDIKEKRGAGYFVLIDPDKQDIQSATELAKICSQTDVDALLIGGSLLFAHMFDELIQSIKKVCDIPVIIFPGGTRQISPYADAILYLSLISGRNPEHLIGQQVAAAPIIKSMELEPISTGYMFIESGNITTAQFVSDTTPIPRAKPSIALAHAIAAEFLGFKMIYLEAGSGALKSVPEEMIQLIHQNVSVPMIVGGGIRTPEEARNKIEAGASFIVTGNILEGNRDSKLIKDFSDAVHVR